MRRYESTWYWWVKEKKFMALVFIVMTIILQFQIKGSAGCLETEKMGLLQLKSYLNSLLPSSQEEGILKSWSDDAGRNGDCCLWERVKCSDSIGGHIVDLFLNGVVPYDGYESLNRALNLSLLHSFPQLKTLDFSTNGFDHLFDPIHVYKSFQKLMKLRTLIFDGNRLNNSMLPFLSAAKSLRTLNLVENRMDGVFPPSELANMTELRLLDLQGNRFSSFSVRGLINLTKLEVLDLSDNVINDIEACDGIRTTKLKKLHLSINRLSMGAGLNGLEHLVELKVLSLAANNFNHTRSVQVLKDMSKLQELDLSSNEFTDLDNLGLVFPSSLHMLDLKWNMLSSTTSGHSKICELMNLRELDLSINALTSMPSCLGNLNRLRTLDLSDNQLNKNLSSFIYGLPSALEFLSLLHNNFNGPFLFSSLVNLTRLTVFKLSSKVAIIRATAGSSWIPMFQLKMLTLQNFTFGSTIPGFIIHQHDLCYIDLSHNEFTGAFPTWLVENNTRLQTLLLKSNLLTKIQLPRLVHGLQALDVSSNRINSSIQEDIGIVFPKLRFMFFSSNQFHGSIPSPIGEMKSLEILDASSNDLSGELPKSLLSSCYSLEVLKLSNNKFKGSIGEVPLTSKNLSLLDISDNSLSGALPDWIGRMSKLIHLNVSRNHLTGPFPRCLYNFSRLEVMDMSYNSFCGSIPSNVNFSSIRELRLQSNKFAGLIPDTLFEVERLEVLDLGNNNFSSMTLNPIRPIGNSFYSLRVLLLRNNSLQSHIPEKLCQLSEIGLLDLSHNNFKGVIPSCLSKMSFGRHRYEYNMEFHVPDYTVLPRCLYATQLIYVQGAEDYQQPVGTIVDFLTKSRDETYQGDILTEMYGMDLSSNELSGDIPVEIGDLQRIRSINLSSNHLTGSIQDSISKLNDLESLDLSNNKLDGRIPPQLASLNSLGFFNVSFNNLSGEIPLNGHLLTFGEMSYIGNAYLCGLPINKSCNPVLEPSASKQANEEEEEGDDVIDMVWFYWTCGAVYISTLLALSVFLFIDSHWSREWLYRVDLLVHHLQEFKEGHVCN